MWKEERRLFFWLYFMRQPEVSMRINCNCMKQLMKVANNKVAFSTKIQK